VAGIVRGFGGSLRPSSTLQTISPEHPNKNRVPVLRSKRSIDFAGKNGIRLRNENRSANDPDTISIAIMVAISNQKSRIDFTGKNAVRFSQKNRDPLIKS
jgi:hypothetical protein